MTPTPKTLRADIAELAWHSCPSCRKHKKGALAAVAAWEAAIADRQTIIDDWAYNFEGYEEQLSALRKRLEAAENARVADNERLHGHLGILEKVIMHALAGDSGWDLRARAMLDPFNRDAALNGEMPSPETLKTAGTLHETTAVDPITGKHRRLVTQAELNAAVDAWKQDRQTIADLRLVLRERGQVMLGLRKRLEGAREGWDLCLAELKRKDKRLEAAEKWRRVAEILRSVVKSGEPWTPTLEAEWDAALAGKERGFGWRDGKLYADDGSVIYPKEAP